MRIILGSLYHLSAHYGGNEQYAHHLAEGMVKAGHEVIYMTAHVGSTVPDVSYDIVSFQLPGVMSVSVPSFDWTRFVSQQRPDVYHTIGSGLPLMMSAYGIRHMRSEIQTVTTFQAPYNPSTTIRKLGGWLDLEGMARSFDGIITTSPFNCELLQSRWPWAKVTFIPMMLSDHVTSSDLTQSAARKTLDLPHEMKVILFVGKLDRKHYYKNFGAMVDLIGALDASYMLLVVGDGDLLAGYRRMVIERNLSERVHFAGFVEDDLMSAYYRAADVFVLPSNSSSEGFGLVLIEAMVSGVPVITTDVIGSAGWFLEAGVCQLVPANSLSILRDTVISSVDSPDTAMIRRAKEFANGFTVERMISETVSFYESLR